MHAVGIDAAGSCYEAVSESEQELNVVLSACDLPIPTVKDLPPLPLDEIILEQGRDENLVIVLEWIDAFRAPTSEELEDLPEAIRTYAELGKDIYTLETTCKA